jgi:hypothetical protein
MLKTGDVLLDCYGLACVPPSSRVEALTLRVTILGERIL